MIWFICLAFISAARGLGTATLPYNGGLVMSTPITIYSIYYGSWSASNPQIAANDNLLSGISSTSYWSMMNQYKDSTGAAPTPNITIGKNVIVNASTNAYGFKWSADVTDQLIFRALVQGVFPASADAIYFLYVSPDVKVPGLCSIFCGYHSYFTVSLSTGGTLDIKYSLIGAPAQCPNGCSLSTELYLGGGFPGVATDQNSAAQIIVHELTETMTDPVFVTYVNDNTGMENADICNSNLGNVNTNTNKTLWDITVNGQNYLISSEYNLKTGLCEMGDGATTLSVNAPAQQWSGQLSQQPGPPPFPPQPPRPPSPPAPLPPPPPITSVSASMVLSNITQLQFVQYQSRWVDLVRSSIHALSVTVISTSQTGSARRKLFQASLTVLYTATTYDVSTTQTSITSLPTSGFITTFNSQTGLKAGLTNASFSGPSAGSPPPASASGPSAGMIAGAVVGSIAGAAVLGAGVWCCFFRRRRRRIS